MCNKVGSSSWSLETTIDDYRVLSAIVFYIVAMPFTADQKRIFDEAYEKAIKLDAGDKLVQLMYLLVELIMHENSTQAHGYPPCQQKWQKDGRGCNAEEGG